VGVLTRIETNHAAQVVDQNGLVKIVTLTDIRKKVNIQRAVTRDVDGNTIGIGDVVDVTKETHVGESGTVKHIYRDVLFLWSKHRLQNSGLIVVQAKLCRLRNIITKNTTHPPASGGKSQVNQRLTMRPLQRQNYRRNNKMLYNTVCVTKGPWKGYLGIIKQTYENMLQIELQTNAKRIKLSRNDVEFTDAKGKQDIQNSSRIPTRGDQTPLRVCTQSPARTSWDPFHPDEPGSPLSSSSPMGRRTYK